MKKPAEPSMPVEPMKPVKPELYMCDRCNLPHSSLADFKRHMNKRHGIVVLPGTI